MALGKRKAIQLRNLGLDYAQADPDEIAAYNKSWDDLASLAGASAPDADLGPLELSIIEEASFLAVSIHRFERNFGKTVCSADPNCKLRDILAVSNHLARLRERHRKVLKEAQKIFGGGQPPKPRCYVDEIAPLMRKFEAVLGPDAMSELEFVDSELEDSETDDIDSEIESIIIPEADTHSGSGVPPLNQAHHLTQSESRVLAAHPQLSPITPLPSIDRPAISANEVLSRRALRKKFHEDKKRRIAELKALAVQSPQSPVPRKGPRRRDFLLKPDLSTTIPRDHQNPPGVDPLPKIR